MTTYRVFNENNVLKKVSDEDLDRAARESGPLATELANAVALSGRADLSARLLATLDAGSRPQRLAAADALLVTAPAGAREALESHAARQSDVVVRSLYRATALRLAGVPALRAVWEAAADPELCSFIPSMYNSRLAPSAEDLELQLLMLRDFLAAERPWIKSTPRDEWRNAVSLITERLCAEAARPLRQQLPAPTRESLREALERVLESGADRETKADAKRALQEWSRS